MRTTVLVAAAALLMLFTAEGAAGASGQPSHRAPDGRAPSPAMVPAPTARFVALGARLAGSATVTGHVYDFGGSALAGAQVSWSATVGGAYEGNGTATGADGLYTFVGLPAADGTGELLVSSPTQPWAIGRFDATWSDPGTATFDFRPGVVTTSLQRGGDWDGWSEVWVDLYGSDTTSAVAGMSLIAGESDTVVGDAWAMPGAYDVGAAYFWMDEGIEFATAATVTAGQRSAQTVSVDQSLAQRVTVTTPYWASGSPGSAVKILHEGYPGLWTLDYVGFSDSPTAPTVRTFGSLATTGTGPFTKSITIPTRAPAGYFYLLEVQHREGPLVLDAPFQVCTLKSSKTSVRKGGSIRLSGVIPTEGHWGGTPGKVKYVTLYKRTRPATAAPTTWDATKKGWTKVARIRANGLGRYLSAYLKPTRTTWYVVRYPGDDWYWGAYTSVLKVKVY